MNKKEALVGLLSTCLLNAGAFREVTYRKVYGDKETFWIGFEASQERYHFFPYIPGTIGISKQTANGDYEICARQILHLDDQKRPLLINGGLAEYKSDKDSPLARMNEWAVEPGQWYLEAHNLACLTTSTSPTPLDEKTKLVLQASGEMFLRLRNKQD